MTKTGAAAGKEWFEGPPGYPDGTQVRRVMHEGLGRSGILAVGEAAGEHEASDGLPFRPYAEAGSVLERAVYRAGIPRESLTITNLVPYRPPRNWLDGAPWESEAIGFGQKYLDDLVAKIKPKVILALGALPMRELTGLMGEKCGIGMTRGFTVRGLHYNAPVIGTFHPSHLRRGSKERAKSDVKGKTEAAGGGTAGGMALLGVLIRDILLAKSVAENGAKKFGPCEHVLGASLDDWKQAATYITARPEDMNVWYDFETAHSLTADDESEMVVMSEEPTQVQIAWKDKDRTLPGKALVSPWFPELLPVLRRIIESPATKYDWNGRKFDRPEVLRALGIRCDIGCFEDVMDMWHHAQPDLPRGLQFAASFFVPEVGPWKHMSGTDPLWYGLLDVDILARVYEGLQATLRKTSHPISNVSLLDGYESQVARLSPVLDRMSERGIPVSEARRSELGKEFETTLARMGEEMQALYPECLKNRHPKKGFARTPKNTTGMAEGTFVCFVKCGCNWSKNVRQKAKIGHIEDCMACGNTGKVQKVQWRWAKVMPFLPGAWQQVLRYLEYRREQDIQDRIEKYLAKHPGWDETAKAGAEANTPWKIPIDYKKGTPTTAEPELRRLAKKTGDTLLMSVLDFREIQKARGTYVEGWKPALDGCVHPDFGYKPATPQLSSQNPNAQNFMAHGELAQRMKGMIAAQAGHVLLSFDYKSFHVLTLGFEAKDARYMRMARIDMHSFFALCGLIRAEDADRVEAMQDEELAEKLRWYRKSDRLYPEFGGATFGEIRDQKAKRCIAEGQLVLTDAGLVPIEKVTLEHRVWDGIEWVKHAGVVYQGEKEVITYAGLTATLDHQVILETGESIRFGEAALRMERLLQTGSGRTPFWAGDRNIRPHSKEDDGQNQTQDLQTNLGPMRYVRSDEVGGSTEPVDFSDWGLSELLTDVFQIPGYSWPALRRYRESMFGRREPSLEGLWRTGDQAFVCLPEGICALGGEEPPSRLISRGGNRSGEQQRTLRTRESEAGTAQGTNDQSPQYGLGEVENGIYSTGGLDKSVYSFVDRATGEVWDERRTDNSTCDREGTQGPIQNVEETPRVVKKARVYDILNAGPRHRFTVSDCLVFNCILGIGFGQQAGSLVTLNPESFANRAEAQMVLDRLNWIFPKPEAWRQDITLKADKDHKLVTRFGHVRHFWDVFSRKRVQDNYQPKGKERVFQNGDNVRWLLTHGDDYEAAIAYLPAADAFGIKRDRMVEFGESGLDERFGLINEVHDDLWFHTPENLVEEALETIPRIMEAPEALLQDPEVAPHGLYCQVEAKMGPDRANMRVLSRGETAHAK